MNENDLRDCFAMFAMNGLLHQENYEANCLSELAYGIADAMLKARKPKDESGIVAVKRSSTKKEK